MSLLAKISVVVAGLPIAAVVTILLAPVWSWFENTTGIESLGHSGPAGWCFVLVYGMWLGAAFGLLAIRARRASVTTHAGRE